MTNSTDKRETDGRINGIIRIQRQHFHGLSDPVLTMDSETERFTGAFSTEANMLLTRNYRKPFVVPEKV